MNMRTIRGYTLVEVLMVIVIIGIGFSVAVPSFQGMQQRNRLVTQVNDFVAAIGLARAEANRSGQAVSLVAAASTSGNEFGGGYCIVTGSMEDASPPDCTGTVIRHFRALIGEATLASLDNAAQGGNWDDHLNGITFDSFGALNDEVVDGQMRYFDLCHPDQLDRRIQIRLIGRVKVWKEAEPGTAPGDIPSIQPDCG